MVAVSSIFWLLHKKLYNFRRGTRSWGPGMCLCTSWQSFSQWPWLYAVKKTLYAW